MEDLTKLHEILKDLLHVFDEVCRSHNLKYYAIAGTLLGAVRHNGFIPWDDDVDVAMLREDYDKFIKLADEFKEPYCLRSMENDKGSNLRHYRLVNNSTTFIPLRYSIYDCNKGAFIDIFPLDVIPDNKKLAEKQTNEISRLKLITNYWNRYDSENVGTVGLSAVKKIGFYLICPAFRFGILNGVKLFRKLDSIASKYQATKSKKIGQVLDMPGNDRCIYDIDDFAETIYMSFEDMTLPVPNGYDNILRTGYGNDYMIPKNVSSQHGAAIYNPYIPWKEYVAEHKDELMALWVKQRNNMDG
ncbi:MAG: LicD family protein [Lachnospiraceae bacterium]|nr:LicD family protein [Lachnospiraceae bacterium]